MRSCSHPRPIVVVDDDESVRHALQDLIESAGLVALCFPSAEQFLKSDARYNAVCVIADLRMPEVSGIEMQARLNAEQSHLPVIFITAHGDPETRALAMARGAVAFLTKPFDDAVLLKAVHRALESEGKKE
jgi:two-component system response regulator FixJ